MSNELLIDKIRKLTKDDPGLSQWISSAIGDIVNFSTGSSANSGAAVALNGTKWNSFSSFYKLHPIPLTDNKFVSTVNLNHLKYALKTASYTDAGTKNERMTLWMGDGDYMIINSGHAYYRDHKLQERSGWPSFYYTDKNTVLEAVASAVIFAEADGKLNDGLKHDLPTTMVLLDTDGKSGVYNVEIRALKRDNKIYVSTFYPVSLVK